MDSTSQRSPMFPAELIQLFIDHLAPDNYDQPLTSFQRRDLASCGLVSASFYTASRKHLFSTVKILYKPDERREAPFVLDDILSANPKLQEHVRHLIIMVSRRHSKLRENSELVRGGGSGAMEGEYLSHLVGLVPALRKLSIENTYSQALRPGFGAILDKLRASCPDLHHLRIVHLDVPLSFILQWTNITDLEIHYTGLLERHYSKQNTVIPTHSTSSPPIIRLTIGESVFYHHLLQKSLDLTRLRYLHLSPTLLEDDREWGLLDNTFPVLNHLSLYHAFKVLAPWHLQYTLCDSKFPALDVIEINEDVETRRPFPYIVDALAPKEGTFSIRHVKITLEAGRPQEFLDLLDKQHQRWAEADTAWTSAQYYSLTMVSIHCTFRFATPFDSIKDQEKLQLVINCAHRLLPRVSSSSIILDFSVKLHFTNFIFGWDSRTGVMTGTPYAIFSRS
ncbi:hypothetical protein BDN70DRAFT_706315 [Pholiota conissans]|uniref:Uncharacterized protein n=1 Tax=Pholiota conissans TaxID=109636 RepID=A0A9P5ZE71_9AGAR|nr:hypothetical protein BDN70DRAFT_706315 [Pholiota conissans]